MTKRSIFVAAGLVGLMVACRETAPAADPPAASQPAAVAPSDPYHAEILKFQQEREALLKTDTGWLTIAGLFFLVQPATTFGSNPLNDIVLPAGAPDKAGTFELKGGKVFVKAEPGVTFMLDGKPVTDRQLRSDGEGPPDRLSLGDLQLWVHQSGDRPSIRLRDKNSKLRKEFTGTSWFPVNASFKVEGMYTPYAKPKIVEVPNILGDIDRMPVPGIVSFTVNGQEMKMEPIAEAGDKEFWFVFRDLTSGQETYPAARFLYAPVPVSGKMTIDFNQAQNPPCAYNPYSTCPLPFEQNRLKTRIEAGEKAYGGTPKS
ncbi:MAG: DUF1684 domain-containing protein [Vicinamibacterales bacterium]|nr:DUF1684 domain-containing protein [Vicinamibacterales bacterium]